MTKLCIITSLLEQYPLIQLCNKHQIPFCMIADTLHGPYEEQDPSRYTSRIQSLIDYALSLGCTHILLPPSAELYHKYIRTYDGDVTIIPLFEHYITHCLQHSLIGKIGYIGGYTHISLIEQIHPIITKSYKLTDNQKTTKSFQNPLSKRTKITTLRHSFIRLINKRNMMINTIIKFDLRYFKDANIDTIIPLDYSYFTYEKTITSFFNQKKQKFHKQDIIENIFKDTIQKAKLTTHNTQPVTIYHTGSSHTFTGHKKWETILSHGGTYTIEYKKVEL